MEFGSVKFFRRVISLTVLIIIIALITAVCFSVYRITKLNNSVQGLEKQLGNKQTEENQNPVDGQASEIPQYQLLFENMTAAVPQERTTAEKTIYLTFDDGPTAVTEQVLDVLKSYDIKATFFVTGKTRDSELDSMKRIVEEGHTIGIHTYSHSYNDIYASVEAYLDDFAKLYDLIYETTGVKAEIFRFPGGTINKYNVDIRKPLTAEMMRRGFTYYDWNCTAQGAGKNISKEDIVKNAIDTGAEKSRLIMVMHDTEANKTLVEALPDIIEYYKEKGYTFDKITSEVKPIAFD